MFGRMMNNFYYGKSGKGDFRKEDLPKNRLQLFFAMLRVRFMGLCSLNVISALAFVPMGLVLGYAVLSLITSLNVKSACDEILLNAGFVLDGMMDESTLALAAQTLLDAGKIQTEVNIALNLSGALQDLLSVSGVGSGVFDVLFTMIDAIYDIVMASGIQIIVFLSGLQAISPSLYEAADIEGCTAWESFWKITFPMVSPLLLVNCIYTIIDFFMKNDNKVMERINEVMYSQFRFGESAAMSWIYFGVALLFIAISSFIITRGVHYYED